MVVIDWAEWLGLVSAPAGSIACDGHGEHGEVIAERVSRVLPLFFSMHLADGVEEALRRAFLAAQSDLEESFGAMQVYSGATVVMCCFQEGAESVWCAYVGDSRLVVGDMETGQPVYCTDEHKAHHPQEYQRLEAAGAQVIQKRYDDGEVISRIFIPKTGVPGLAMSRSLGDGCLKKYGVSAEPDICDITGQWQACQFPAMMLGSDGLWAQSPVFPEALVNIRFSPHVRRRRSRRASEMSAMDWDWGQQIRSDDWLIAMLKGGALSAFLAVVMLCVKAMQNSGATIAPKGSKRDEKKMKRIRLPEDCVRLIEKEVKDKEEHAEHANGIREKMYDRVCGAADNVFEILRRLRRTEDWWDRHEVVEEVVQEKYSDLRPVLVFVNTRSGGQQGSKILHEMQEYLHAAQVVELQREGPDAALQWWDKTKLPYRILVCGGDGTAGWVLGALEQLKAEDKLSQTQPLGILPIGTGNDLARVLNWGGGYTNSSVLPALQQMRSAKTKLLDRWRVLCRDKKKEDMEEPAGDKDELGQGEDKEEKEERDKEEPGDKVKWVSRPHFLPVQPDRKIMAMSNYLGIGVDAAVAMDFHQMRERRPGLFVSQLVNKLWYFRSGYRNWMTKHCANIGEKMELFCVTRWTSPAPWKASSS
ncbi:unnamed protein product [Effrenium voratum]|uniref:Diacylglycerol kinase n=1 Tax=Effrenium voratum TaxID=2562239 RepID=A0AA36HP87_9DINO|nr:unnamed protein product [Effrenium voratum]